MHTTETHVQLHNLNNMHAGRGGIQDWMGIIGFTSCIHVHGIYRGSEARLMKRA